MGLGERRGVDDATFALRRGHSAIGAVSLHGWRARLTAIARLALSAVWFYLPQIVAAMRAAADADW